jgi:aspartyl-tRNA(Asn)/glutamyl-tRNA(Gln) amidotransferase subunit A
VALFDMMAGLTAPFSLTGSPAISIPCGFTSDRLPVGLQIAARGWNEAMVLRIAAAYERVTPWHRLRPPLSAQ